MPDGERFAQAFPVTAHAWRRLLTLGLKTCSLFTLFTKNNSKFVRGKTRAREQIEAQVLSRYAMEKHPSGCEYTLTIPYETDEELERIIYEDILREADNLADLRYCFIEADVSALDGSGRRW